MVKHASVNNLLWRVFLWRNPIEKSIKKSPSITRIAGPDDPIYKEGWTITTTGYGADPRNHILNWQSLLAKQINLLTRRKLMSKSKKPPRKRRTDGPPRRHGKSNSPLVRRARRSRLRAAYGDIFYEERSNEEETDG